jgi:excisionase family DNA binding protein
MTQAAQSTLFPPKQAAEYLGVSVGTLEVWRCTKRYPLPFIKVGRLVKYRKSDLDAFLESRTVGAEA